MNPTLDPKIVKSFPRLVRNIQHGLVNLGAKAPPGVDPEVYRVRPWYHNYSVLGVTTNFDDQPSPGEKVANRIRGWLGKGTLHAGSHPHQRERDLRLLPLLQEARDLYAREFGTGPQSFLEPMGADGFYSFYAVKKLGFQRAHCIDLEPEQIRRGTVMRRVLDLPQVKFTVGNVYDLSAEKYDVGLSSGGLYHVPDPERVLKMMRERVRVLVVLTSVSQNSDSPSYLVTPVPGWPHGSAFSRQWLAAAAERVGWKILKRDGFAYEYGIFDSKLEGVELLLCI